VPEGFLNVARVLERTRAEGPGLRFCIWTQGCLRNCPGCCNAAMQPLEPRMLVPAREMASRVLAAAERYNLEGVTFLGGEPLLQAKGLAEVARAARAAGLTVMVFTGFTLEECRANPLPGVPELLASTDVLVDGPYLADRPEPSRNWIGSSNQRFRYLTGAYGPAIETDPAYRGQIEFRIEGDSLRMNGCPRTLPANFSLMD
jgi:anaerobic ribonucleoside-triphosphate reductase activating protein